MARGQWSLLATRKLGSLDCANIVMSRDSICFAPFATLAAVAALTQSGAAAPMRCKEIKKGNIQACLDSVKSQCTSKSYLEQMDCEERIAIAADACITGDYEEQCAKLRPLVRDVCAKLDLWIDAPDAFVERAAKLAQVVADYRAFDSAWSACYSAPVSSSRNVPSQRCIADPSDARACERAPAAYRTALASAIARELGDAVLPTPQQLVAPGAEVDPDIHTKLTSARKTATQLAALNAKLPADLRYKESEIAALAARSDEAIRIYDENLDRLAQKRRCPGGRPPSGEAARLIKSEFSGNDGTRMRATRITGGTTRSVDRATRISSESIPAAVCREFPGDKPHCAVTTLSVFRDKAPGGPWSSWRLAIGETTRISCKM